MIIDVHPTNKSLLIIRVEYSERWRLEVLPSKAWNKSLKAWEVLPGVNLQTLRHEFQKEQFTPEAMELLRITALNEGPVNLRIFDGKYPGEPMRHQSLALSLAQDKKSFFFAHAMGTGKTYTILTLCCHLYSKGKIQGLLVVCPASIREDVWVKEVHKWTSLLNIPAVSHVIHAGKHAATQKFLETEDNVFRLQVLIASVESLSNEKQKAYGFCDTFLKTRSVAMAVDESSRIKNYKAKRTKNVIELGQNAEYRYCGTGTSVTQGLHDLYSQYRFLDWKIIGQKSFYTFRNRYCQMGGFEAKQIIGYQNIGELFRLIGPYTHVVRKEDANDLPPKVYETRHVVASAEQKRVYAQLETYMEATIGDMELKVDTILERMMRFQQIAGGNFPIKTEDGWETEPLSSNPKLYELLEILDETDEQVIIWARFIPEILAIETALATAYGVRSVVTFYGGTVDRESSIARFRSGEARFFVANQQTAGMGLTLTEATLVIYFSNSFSYEDRVQSEDRCHRTGQNNKVTYIDLLSDLKIDHQIQQAQSRKTSMAKYVADELSLG
mgnify:CR=1 FL=1